ncbi:MAG TPA: helix-turn-helix transcriptional regulator [Gemmatimonadaceae bacterium]
MSTSATPILTEENGPGVTPATGAISTVAPAGDTVSFAAPRLTPLGKRIEMLRVERGFSKQSLARSAGTSRQQLWRVMTGKSELTSTLCHRLASVLDVDSRSLSSALLGGSAAAPNGTDGRPSTVATPVSLAAFLESPALLARTLRTLPAGEDGIAIKRALLDAIEDRARLSRAPIPSWLFRVRASILDGSA